MGLIVCGAAISFLCVVKKLFLFKFNELHNFFVIQKGFLTHKNKNKGYFFKL